MTAIPAWFVPSFFGLFGLLFGSFANVVIWRVPRGESISTPGSHCPGCDAPIAWYDNVPVVSWLVLRARCRGCGERISSRYPLVEIASGVLFIAAALAFSDLPQAAWAAVLFWFLLVLSMIDLDTLRLPNVLVGTLAGLGLLGALVSELAGIPFAPLVGVAAHGVMSHPLAVAGIGLLLGGGVPAGIAAVYGVVRNRSGLGMGDVKLLGTLGLFLGPFVLVGLFLGSLLAIVAGLWGARRAESVAETRIPFGPWLSAGAVLAALFGPALIGWYLQLVGIV